MSVSSSRVVAVLTPLIAAGAAVGTPWLVKLTGLAINSAEVTAFGVAGAGAVVGVAVKWLDGHSKWERDVLALNHETGVIDKTLAHEASKADSADPGLTARAKEIVEEFLNREGSKVVEEVGAPAAAWPAAEKVAEQVMAAVEVPAPAPVASAPVVVPVAVS